MLDMCLLPRDDVGHLAFCPQGVAKMIAMIATRRQQEAQSAPDLSDDTVFSNRYGPQGELLCAAAAPAAAAAAAAAAQTPRGVKQRHELKRQIHDSNADSGCVDDSPSSSCSDPQRSPRGGVRQVHIEVVGRGGEEEGAGIRERDPQASRRERQLKAAKAKALRRAWLEAEPAMTDSVKQARSPTPTTATIVDTAQLQRDQRESLTSDIFKSPTVRHIEVKPAPGGARQSSRSPSVRSTSHRRQHSADSVDTSAGRQDSWRYLRPVIPSVDLSDGEMTDATDITLDAMVSRNLRPADVASGVSECSRRVVSATYSEQRQERYSERRTTTTLTTAGGDRPTDDMSFSDLVTSFEQQAMPFLRPPRVERGEDGSGRPHSWTHT